MTTIVKDIEQTPIDLDLKVLIVKKENWRQKLLDLLTKPAKKYRKRIPWM